MKNHFLKTHRLVLKAGLFVLLGIDCLLFALAFLFVTLDVENFIDILRISLAVLAGLFCAVTAAGLLRKKSIIPVRPAAMLLFPVNALLLVCFLAVSGMILFSFSAGNPQGISLTTPFFSDKNVMIIIPHQDDDINLAGGIIEQYVQAGSRVSVVFSTNGDCYNMAEARFEEAVRVLTALGASEDCIHFLGYGDQWLPQLQDGRTVSHIYNSAYGSAPWMSLNRRTETYGTSVKDCYEARTYTRSSYAGSLKGIIAAERPDVIYCTDYDSHIDHKALDLFFEEVMGQLLREDPAYRPVVYKGFCYGTAWVAPMDFAGPLNLLSTKHPVEEIWTNTGAVYRWEERVRLPVGGDNLNRFLSNTGVYRSLQGYASQNAYRHAALVLNGDKVFWERRTDSLLYSAEFFADGEPVHLLNDFKLKDSPDISLEEPPTGGAAQFSQADVVLESPAQMDSIVLYDSPDPEQNVLSGVLRFDDGSEIPFGPLSPTGCATPIAFEKKTVSAFSVILTDVQGDQAGLSEIEAFLGGAQTAHQPALLMPVDGDDNFVYDHRIVSGDQAAFTLYTYPHNMQPDFSEVRVEFDGDPQCSYEIDDGRLIIRCPKHKQARVTVIWRDLSASFTVSNPGAFTRTADVLMQRLNLRMLYTIESLKAYWR